MKLLLIPTVAYKFTPDKVIVMSEDIYGLKKRMDVIIDKMLNSSDGFFAEDKEDIRKFYSWLVAKGLSELRVMKYITHLKTLARMLGKPFKTASKEDLVGLVGQIERRADWVDWTKHDMKTILRRYYKWLYGFEGQKGYPEIVAWINTKIKNSSSKLPKEILTEEDVKKMAEAAYTTRDKAFVLALYESGCRIGEFLPLKIKNLEFDEYGCVLIVSGKTGDRRIRLVASALAMQRWLEEHPDKLNPNAYLWVKVPSDNNPKNANKHLSYGFVCKLLRELAEKAGVKKPVNPHAFRHARATFLANKLTEAQMKEFFGWTKDSDMASVYVHLSGRDVDDAIMQIYGIKEVRKEESALVPMVCPRCGEKNIPGSLFCRKCGMPLNDNKLAKVEDLLIDFFKVLGETFPQAREKFVEVAKRKGMLDLFVRDQ